MSERVVISNRRQSSYYDVEISAWHQLALQYAHQIHQHIHILVAVVFPLYSLVTCSHYSHSKDRPTPSSPTYTNIYLCSIDARKELGHKRPNSPLERLTQWTILSLSHNREAVCVLAHHNMRIFRLHDIFCIFYSNTLLRTVLAAVVLLNVYHLTLLLLCSRGTLVQCLSIYYSPFAMVVHITFY